MDDEREEDPAAADPVTDDVVAEVPEVPEQANDSEPVGHENFTKLSSCAVFLEGETVLPKPRVSREAMISVMKEHSILGRLMKGDEDHQESFDRGCIQALESSFGLLSQLFSARTMGLFQQVEEKGIHSFLSGLILGSELKEAFSRFLARKEKKLPSLKLIGEGKLVESYKRAFQLAGHDCEMVSGTPTTVGLMKMARFASII